MKRKSDLAKHQLPKNFPHDDSEFQYVRKQAKRNYTIFNNTNDLSVQRLTHSISRNQSINPITLVSHIINDLINNLQPEIQLVQRKRTISLTLQMTTSIGRQLLHLQDPQKDFNQICRLAQKQPAKNTTDPISGFNKQHFIKKSLMKKISCDQSNIRQTSETKENPIQGQNVRKLPTLMKQLSQQKLQNQTFVSLQENTNLGRKKSSLDFEEMVRDRFLKQIENRKFKQRMQAISTAAQLTTTNNANVKGKNNSKFSHETQKFGTVKQDCNFDYDGTKITVFSLGKAKPTTKILKPVYKIPKQQVQQSKQKLQKKFHQRISYIPRCSRNYLQINSKTISDFGDINYSTMLKQKLEMELRKTDMKFCQKDSWGNQKERDEKKEVI